MSRPSKDQWGIAMASLASTRSTCHRRKVGCVLVNSRGHVMATGYNGVAARMPHCIEHPEICPGRDAPSGTGLDGCQAIHAEQNALLQCKDVYAIDTCYTTASPCMTCVKLLLNTGCRRIVFMEEYPHPQAKELWESSGLLDFPMVKRKWIKA